MYTLYYDPEIGPTKEWADAWNQDAKKHKISVRVTSTGAALKLVRPKKEADGPK